MYAGLAGALLIFTGIWHATEWMMDGRRRDTWLLVPAGLIYLILGCLIVMGTGGLITQIIALVVTATFGAAAFVRRNLADVRKWVTWTFIGVDLAIVLALLGSVVL